MVDSKKEFDNLHRENKKQAKKRIKRERRKIGGLKNESTNKVWIRSRRRLRTRLLRK